ncbi:DNA repair protein RAD5A [Eurytemora carolleeae]|uniref:DNA repair protein RAD5A n=1 Tax=Eurytemora carolleeae TaxID=1294199 RepID=UPI000C78B745|nr:DNA repair protein RAD5A [Eurytemora carolleeae]|eukprot:XP_023346317.1 DNA repair protein RAD5A-like [Eurytemora affinis]
MYSLIRFLRCAPFDEYMVWKRWVENKSVQSTERMNTLIKSLLLRRTKDQKSNLTGKSLVNLPDKNMILHEITLSEQEKEVYSEAQIKLKAWDSALVTVNQVEVKELTKKLKETTLKEQRMARKMLGLPEDPPPPPPQPLIKKNEQIIRATLGAIVALAIAILVREISKLF